AAERRPGDPLVMMGGVCAFSNPEPMAPFMDFIAVGEGEELVRELITLYRDAGSDRDVFLDRVGKVAGGFVSSRHLPPPPPPRPPPPPVPPPPAPAPAVSTR